MSQDDKVAQSVRVINEEYDRVLSNPDNIIMSDELHALMDLNLESNPLLEDEPPSVDTMTIVLFDTDGLPHKARGDLSELSSDGSSYTIKMTADKVSKEVLALLGSSHVPLTPGQSLDSNVRIVVEGIYNLDFTAEIFSWSVKRSTPHTLELQISFRSSNVIF